MKTFAHINELNDVVGIGMVYLEPGGFTPEVQSYVDALGEDAGLLVYGDKVKADATLSTVVIDTAEMPGGNGFAFDKTFCNAFKHGGGHKVLEDLVKAKEITHERRRVKRAAEFAPLDVEATIPAKAAQAETARQAIRDRHAAIQAGIDAATTPDALRAIIETNAL